MTERVKGSLTVSDDVLADLVGHATRECYGVVAMSAPAPANVQEGIAGLLPAQRHRRGIEISHSESGALQVDLHVVLEYGVNISAVSHNLVDQVKYFLGGIAQIGDVEVVVHVEGMKVREV